MSPLNFRASVAFPVAVCTPYDAFCNLCGQNGPRAPKAGQLKLFTAAHVVKFQGRGASTVPTVNAARGEFNCDNAVPPCSLTLVIGRIYPACVFGIIRLLAREASFLVSRIVAAVPSGFVCGELIRHSRLRYAQLCVQSTGD